MKSIYTHHNKNILQLRFPLLSQIYIADLNFNQCKFSNDCGCVGGGGDVRDDGGVHECVDG